MILPFILLVLSIGLVVFSKQIRSYFKFKLSKKDIQELKTLEDIINLNISNLKHHGFCFHISNDRLLDIIWKYRTTQGYSRHKRFWWFRDNQERLRVIKMLLSKYDKP